MATTVSDMIANVRTQRGLPPPFSSADNDIGLTMNSDVVVLAFDGVTATLQADMDGEMHCLLLGGVTTHCFRTASRFDFGDRVLHRSTNTHATVVGVSLDPASPNMPLFDSLLLSVPNHALRKTSKDPAYNLWIVSLTDIECVYPKQKCDGDPDEPQSLRARATAIIESGANLMFMRVNRRGVRRSKRVRQLDVEAKACESVSKKSSPAQTTPPLPTLNTPLPSAAGTEELIEGLRRSARSQRSQHLVAEKALKEQTEAAEKVLGQLHANLESLQGRSAKKKATNIKLAAEIRQLDTEMGNKRKIKKRREHTLQGSSDEAEVSIEKFCGNVVKKLGAEMSSASVNLNKNVGKLLDGWDGSSKVLDGVSAQIAKMVQAQPGLPDMQTYLDKFASGVAGRLTQVETTMTGVDGLLEDLRGKVALSLASGSTGNAGALGRASLDSHAFAEQVASAMQGKLDALVASGQLGSTASASATAIAEELRTQALELRTTHAAEHAAEHQSLVAKHLSDQFKVQAANMLHERTVVAKALNDQLSVHAAKLAQDTNVAAELSEMTTKMARKLELQEKDLTERRMQDIKDMMENGQRSAASEAEKNSSALQLAWANFTTKQANDQHSKSLLRLETLVGETNKSLQAHSYTQGMAQVLSDQHHNKRRAIDANLSYQPNRRQPFDPDRSLDPNWEAFDGGLVDRGNNRGKRARGGRGPLDPVPEDPGASSLIQDPSLNESDAKINWELWTPIEMVNWMENMGAEALSDILFPTEAHSKAPIVLKHGSQLQHIDASVLASIGVAEAKDSRLIFAKMTFLNQLARLLKDYPPAL